MNNELNIILQNELAIDRKEITMGQNIVAFLIPSSLAMGVIAASNDLPIQLSALIVLAFSVSCLWRYLNKITESHQQERAKLVEELRADRAELSILCRQAFKVINRVSDVLADHSCLEGDKRIDRLKEVRLSESPSRDSSLNSGELEL
jgi:hypothetical protein